MKILFLVNSLGFGGAERTVSYLSSYLAVHGEDVVIYTMTDKIKYSINPKIRLIKENLPTSYHNRFEKIANIARRIVKIYKTIKKENPDVVFCIMAGNAKYLLYTFGRQYKLIVSERTNPKYSLPGDRKLEKKIIQKSDGVIFQTERVKENFRGYIEEKSTVIPNAVGNNLVYQMEWNPDSRCVIAAVGRLSYEKKYSDMIQAFQKFLQTHREYTLEIYGEGAEEDNLREFIQKNHLEKSVLFMGTSENVIQKISDACCYVMTSLYEGMPNSLMEAMGIGMPCIATDCEYGPGELIANGWNGLLVPVGDIEAIAAAMSQMADDKEFAMKCGRNARKILETNNIENICSRYHKYIYQVAGEDSDY